MTRAEIHSPLPFRDHLDDFDCFYAPGMVSKDFAPVIELRKVGLNLANISALG